MKGWFDTEGGRVILEHDNGMKVEHGNYGSVVYERAADKAHRDVEFWTALGNEDAATLCANREAEHTLIARVLRAHEDDPTGRQEVFFRA